MLTAYLVLSPLVSHQDFFPFILLRTLIKTKTVLDGWKHRATQECWYVRSWTLQGKAIKCYFQLCCSKANCHRETRPFSSTEGGQLKISHRGSQPRQYSAPNCLAIMNSVYEKCLIIWGSFIATLTSFQILHWTFILHNFHYTQWCLCMSRKSVTHQVLQL